MVCYTAPLPRCGVPCATSTWRQTHQWHDIKPVLRWIVQEVAHVLTSRMRKIAFLVVHVCAPGCPNATYTVLGTLFQLCVHLFNKAPKLPALIDTHSMPCVLTLTLTENIGMEIPNYSCRIASVAWDSLPWKEKYQRLLVCNPLVRPY